MLYELNGLLFKEILKNGEANLSNHQKEINALNVFPVPDGDTGTNMSMTFTNGLKEAITVSSSSVSEVARALSKGLLMGARGNSGVITSQIFRGFYQAIDGKEVVTVEEIAKAFENGARVAYKAIMKPVEGTILTVIKEGSWYANQYVEKADHRVSLEEYFDNLTNNNLIKNMTLSCIPNNFTNIVTSALNPFYKVFLFENKYEKIHKMGEKVE